MEPAAENLQQRTNASSNSVLLDLPSVTCYAGTTLANMGQLYTRLRSQPRGPHTPAPSSSFSILSLQELRTGLQSHTHYCVTQLGQLLDTGTQKHLQQASRRYRSNTLLPTWGC